MKNFWIFSILTGALLWSGISPLSVFAAAPPKLSGQPYAESICSSDPNIILCEDFDDPSIATCTGTPSSNGARDFQWFNSGLSGNFGPEGSGRVICDGYSFIPASQFPAPQPPGSPSGGYAKKAQYQASPQNGSTWRGCLWGDCDRRTADPFAGAKYKNGNPAQRGVNIRFQYYISQDHTFPRKFDNKFFFLQPNNFLDNPSAAINSGLFVSRNSPYCNGHAHPDGLILATGRQNAWPGKLNDSGTPNPQYHGEYCNGQGMGNNNGPLLHINESEGACPGSTWGCNLNDQPSPGSIYRVSKGKWITLEFRYVPGTHDNFDGSAAVWVDGVKIYEDFDLRTCNFDISRGECAVTDFFFGAYVGRDEPTDGYWLIDNLVISTAYIGPPQGGSGNSGDQIPPNPPQNLRLF